MSIAFSLKMDFKQNYECSHYPACHLVNNNPCAEVIEHFGSVGSVSCCGPYLCLEDCDMNIGAMPICESAVKQGSTKQCKMARIPRKFARARPLSEEELDRKRVTANIQERRRMQRLNMALDKLKRAIPQHLHVQYRRLSKIKTLKLAIDYISFLDEVLHRDRHSFAAINPSQVETGEFKPVRDFTVDCEASSKQHFSLPVNLETTDTSVNALTDDTRYANCDNFAHHDSMANISTFADPECDELLQYNQNVYFTRTAPISEHSVYFT